MNRDKSILGIHINDDFLNIVHMEQTTGGPLLRDWTTEPLEAGVVEKGLIIDEQAISQKIRDFVKVTRLKSRKAIMSLSCSTVRLKLSEFPMQTDEELRKQVEDQIRKYALFGSKEVVSDHCIFEDTNQSYGKQTVLQAVTTRQISDACLAVAKRAGLDLMKIEPAMLPIMKLTYDKPLEDSDIISLLLAMDSTSANIAVFKNAVPQFCQNLSIGIKNVLKQGDDLNLLTEQIKPVLRFARARMSADTQQLTLKIAADCSSGKLQSIISHIKQTFSDIKVEPISRPQITKQFDVQGVNTEDIPIFAFACALTSFGVSEFAGNLNLVSQKSLTANKMREEMSLTAKAIVAVVLLSIAITRPLEMQIKDVEAASARIETKFIEATPTRRRITSIKKQIEQLNEKHSAYTTAYKKLTDIPWPQVLEDIAETVPNETRILDISPLKDLPEFTLIGQAVAESNVYSFAKRLQNTRSIENTKVEEIKYNNKDNTTVVDYKIACRIQLSESNL